MLTMRCPCQKGWIARVVCRQSNSCHCGCSTALRDDMVQRGGDERRVGRGKEETQFATWVATSRLINSVGKPFHMYLIMGFSLGQSPGSMISHISNVRRQTIMKRDSILGIQSIFRAIRVLQIKHNVCGERFSNQRLAAATVCYYNVVCLIKRY